MSDDKTAQEIARLAAELNDLAKGNVQFDQGHTTTEIRERARQIVYATRDPEARWEEYMIWLGEMGAVRIFHHLYAFEKIPHHGSITYRELAEQVDADARLIERFGNMLVSVGILNLEGADRISHTPRSQIFLDHHPTGLMCNSLMDIMGRASLNYHMYFDKYGLKEPGGAFTTTPASYGFGQPDKNIWAIMSENPRVMEEFSIGMNIMEKFLPVLGMYDFSWVAEYAKNGPDKERKLIVDVGCGKGHSLKAFLGEQPDIPAERCVLQDRIDVIKHVKQLDEPELRKAEKQVIDFFIDEPVKRALIYFIRRCMHDWSDDWNVKMLSNVRKACASDSRVLICEQLLASPPIPSQASLDLCMMDIGGCERNERMFKEVADRAGLDVVGIFRDKQSPVAILECAPKPSLISERRDSAYV